jgi:hypothetical protein
MTCLWVIPVAAVPWPVREGDVAVPLVGWAHRLPHRAKH